MIISSIDKDISEILSSGFYKIPRFQRPYSWSRENIEDFWNDVVVNSDDDYFIGSMVVYQIQKGFFGVVDGQQRLTTITIILGAIRDAFESIGESKLANGTQGLIEKKDVNNESKFILITESSYPFFHEKIQKFGAPDEVFKDLKKEEINIESAFKIIGDKISQELNSIENSVTIKEEEKGNRKIAFLKRVRDRILGLKLIYIFLTNQDDAYLIFETLNTRGKDLRVSDLVKSHLVKLLPKKNTDVDLSKDKWTQILETIEGSNEDLSIDTFLLHFWLSKYEYTTSKKLFKLIKKEVKKANAQAFLNDLKMNAQLYRAILDADYRSWSKNEIELAKSLRAVNIFKVKQPIPMLLSVLREYESKTIKLKAAKDIIRSIEYFHFIFTAVTSQRSSGGISLMYAYHARELENASDSNGKAVSLNELKVKLRGKVPSLIEFKANFLEIFTTSKISKYKSLVRYILIKYDQYNRGENGLNLSIDYDSLTIEHIYPENPKTVSKLPDEEVGMIGNLILVDHKLNEALGTKSFADKKQVLVSSDLHIDDDIQMATKWEMTEILKRTESIAEVCYSSIFKI